MGPMEMTEGWTSILVVQDHAQKAAMDRQPAVVAVIDKAQLPEFVHEMTDARSGRAHHLRQALLIDARKYRFRYTFPWRGLRTAESGLVGGRFASPQSVVKRLNL